MPDGNRKNHNTERIAGRFQAYAETHTLQQRSPKQESKAVRNLGLTEVIPLRCHKVVLENKASQYLKSPTDHACPHSKNDTIFKIIF